MLTIRFDRLGVRPGDLVLDAGAGFGRHAFQLARLGANVVALDYSAEEMVTTRNTFGAMAEAGLRIEPTGPFDPQLPVLDFRDPAGRTLALLFNHSTHTIGTRSGRDVRSPSFYGLAAQELEGTLGGDLSYGGQRLVDAAPDGRGTVRPGSSVGRAGD